MARKKVKGPPPRPEATRIPGAMFFRMFVLGSVAVIASVYAIVRYYTVPRPPMLVPVPAATEIPVPDFVLDPDAGAR